MGLGGVEWGGVEWSGLRRSGVEWSGVEWIGVGDLSLVREKEGGRRRRKDAEASL